MQSYGELQGFSVRELSAILGGLSHYMLVL